MAFSALFQFQLNDEAGRGRFLIEHYVEHIQFYKALLAQNPSVITVNYPIQHMDDPKTWLGKHQEMSQAVWSGIGGGQSTDFGTLDFNDKNQVMDWFFLHNLWHQQVRASLNL